MMTLIRALIFATQSQVIVVLLRKKIFKCVFEDTSSNYGRMNFHIAKIIASFTKFFIFCEIICAPDECACLIREN